MVVPIPELAVRIFHTPGSCDAHRDEHRPQAVAKLRRASRGDNEFRSFRSNCINKFGRSARGEALLTESKIPQPHSENFTNCHTLTQLEEGTLGAECKLDPVRPFGAGAGRGWPGRAGGASRADGCRLTLSRQVYQNMQRLLRTV